MPRDWTKDPLPDNDDQEAMLDLQDEIDKELRRIELEQRRRGMGTPQKGQSPSEGGTTPEPDESR